MKKIAIIVAAGAGTRMNHSTPKQFLLLHNKPLVYYSILSFLRYSEDMEVILVLPEEHMGKGQEIIDGYFDPTRIILTAGGRTRFHSVKNGLGHIKNESIIFVHDGVRCLISRSLIHKCYEDALKFGSAIPAISSTDSVRILMGQDNVALDRNNVKMVQTPQTFHSGILLPAYNIDYKEKFTDEAAVVEAYGLKVHLTEGEMNNIKITRPADLILAESLLLE